MMSDEYKSGKHNGKTDASLEGLAKGTDRLELTSDRILNTLNKHGERIARLEMAISVVQWIVGILAAGCTAAVGWILAKIHTGG